MHVFWLCASEALFSSFAGVLVRTPLSHSALRFSLVCERACVCVPPFRLVHISFDLIFIFRFVNANASKALINGYMFQHYCIGLCVRGSFHAPGSRSRRPHTVLDRYDLPVIVANTPVVVNERGKKRARALGCHCFSSRPLSSTTLNPYSSFVR